MFESDSTVRTQERSENKLRRNRKKGAMPKSKRKKKDRSKKYKGVQKSGKRFTAQITIDGKLKYLGRFTRARDAAMAYDKAIVKYHQPRTKFNFPDGMPLEDQYSDEDGYWM